MGSGFSGVFLADFPGFTSKIVEHSRYLLMLGAYFPENLSLLHDIFLQKNAVVFLSEASLAYRFLGPSPLLREKPSIYFALLIELMDEIGSYYSYSPQQLLRCCSLLGATTTSFEQSQADPYAMDAEVLLFHTLFSHWPEHFFALLDILSNTAQFPSAFLGHDTLHSRWRGLLARKWRYIAPGWLVEAFEEHYQQYRLRNRRIFSRKRV